MSVDDNKEELAAEIKTLEVSTREDWDTLLNRYEASLPLWKKVWNGVRKYLHRPVYQAWYWIRCHTYNRYHMVDCGHKNPTGYRWGWQDVDYLMLYSAFELLRRFVELENGLEMLEHQGEGFIHLANAYTLPADADTREAHLAEAKKRDATYEEVLQLYNWWTVLRPQEFREAQDAGGSPNNANDFYEKDTDMLCRLMRVRAYLWT